MSAVTAVLEGAPLGPAPRGRGMLLVGLAVRLAALGALAAILLYFALAARGFLTPFNIINVVEQSAILGVLALGMTVVFIAGGTEVQTGGIDLSIAANAGLSAAVFATLSAAGYPPAPVVLATLGTGLGVGALNALAVVGLGIGPLLATLAVMNLAAGLELTLTENTVVAARSAVVTALASGRALGIPALAWVLILFATVMILVVHRMPVGLRLYAVGGHPEAARAAGIRTGAYVAGSYLFAGLAAGLAGILSVARLSASTPGTGELLLSVLAAALLGTVFSRRLVPTMGGTLVAVIFVGLLANGFQLLGVSSYWVAGIQGALILAVVAATTLARPQER